MAQQDKPHYNGEIVHYSYPKELDMSFHIEEKEDFAENPEFYIVGPDKINGGEFTLRIWDNLEYAQEDLKEILAQKK